MIETNFPWGENVWSSPRIQKKLLECAALGLVGCYDLKKGFDRALTFKPLSSCLQIHQLPEMYIVRAYNEQLCLITSWYGSQVTIFMPILMM